MDKIFEKRVGVFISQAPSYIKCSWPLGKITTSTDRLVITAVTKTYVLKYPDIDYIQQNFFNTEIAHHAPDVPESVSLHGLGLNGGIRRTVQEHRLGIELK